MNEQNRNRFNWPVSATVGVLLVLSLLLAACATPPAALPAATESAAAVATAAPVAEATAAPVAATAAPAEAATEAPTAESAPAPADVPPTFEGVTWQVTEYAGPDGTGMAPVADATVTFQNGQVNGNAGCNGFFAGYIVDGAQLTVTQGGSTMMACDEATMAQEQAILAALEQAASYVLVDGTLTILDGEGATLLALTAQVTPALTSVVWQATDYNNGKEAVVNVLDGVQITAIFAEDGTLSGSAGCNNYVAGYTVDGAQLTIAPAATTMMFCVEPEGIMEQEAAYLAALATAATYSIRDGLLELRTADDALALRYRVATDSVVVAPEAASADPDPVAADTTVAPVAFAAAAAQIPSGRVTAQLGVNIRVGPGTQFPVVGIAPLDTEGEIIGVSADGQWWAARVPSAPDEQGWVAAAYVEASNADDVPVLPAPPLPQATAAIQAGVPYQAPQGVILYSASRRVREGNRAYELEDIYAVPPTPGAQPELVANNAMQPALSPDRKTLAVHSMQSDKLGLGGFDVATGRRLRFSAFNEDSSPRWSPTGDRIVFASNRQGDRRWRIYITDAVDQPNPANMTYTELDFGKDPDWHPSAELLILKGCDPQGQNCGLYTMKTDGSERTLFTNELSDSMPRWLPDGNAVVFMSEDRDGNWELYRASTADGAVTRLTNDPAPDGLPAVSPDGQQIAFLSKRSEAWGLWVMPAAGGEATQIAAIAGELPDWLSQSVDWPR